jgi:hypothetical protein
MALYTKEVGIKIPVMALASSLLLMATVMKENGSVTLGLAKEQSTGIMALNSKASSLRVRRMETVGLNGLMAATT